MNKLHRHLPTVFLVFTILVVAIYWIALAASHELDYSVVGFTFRDALGRTAQVSLNDLLQDRFTASQLWFVPFALIVAVLYFAFRAKRFRVAFLVAGLGVPFLKFTPAIILCSVPLPLFLFGSPDGEEWGEAWLALSAIGAWTLLAVFVLVGDFVLRERPSRGAPADGRPAGSSGGSGNLSATVGSGRAFPVGR